MARVPKNTDMVRGDLCSFLSCHYFSHWQPNLQAVGTTLSNYVAGLQMMCSQKLVELCHST